MRRFVLLLAGPCVVIGWFALLAPATDSLPVYDYRTPTYDAALGWVSPPRSLGDRGLVAVGDSWTWGYHVRAAEAWPALLGATNAGICGYGYDQMVLYAERLRAFGSHRLIVALCSDDILRLSIRLFAGAPKPWIDPDLRWHAPAARPNLLARTVLRKWQERKWETGPCSLDEISWALTGRLGRLGDVRIVLYRWPDVSGSIFAGVLGGARVAGVRVLDLGGLPHGAFLSADRWRHPTAAGHRLIARRVAEALAS